MLLVLVNISWNFLSFYVDMVHEVHTVMCSSYRAMSPDCDTRKCCHENRTAVSFISGQQRRLVNTPLYSAFVDGRAFKPLA